VDLPLLGSSLPNLDSEAWLPIQKAFEKLPQLALRRGVHRGVNKSLFEGEILGDSGSLQLLAGLVEENARYRSPVDPVSAGPVVPVQLEVLEIDEDPGLVGHPRLSLRVEQVRPDTIRGTLSRSPGTKYAQAQRPERGCNERRLAGAA
jgi:hypothetical protein